MAKPWRAWQERAPHGPWHVDMGDRGELYIGHLPSGEPDAEGALLVAAAPDLREALAELLDATLTETPLKESAGRRAFARDKARAALAKAIPTYPA